MQNLKGLPQEGKYFGRQPLFSEEELRTVTVKKADRLFCAVKQVDLDADVICKEQRRLTENRSDQNSRRTE